jgi:hypothetical protein
MEGGVTADCKRRKVVLYNPQAVFFTMPLALLAIGSELEMLFTRWLVPEQTLS